jgi:YD repeat-containing protein
MSTALPIVLPAQPAPRRRDPLLIGGWRAGLTRFMSVVLFVTFIGGPTAILRACEDDPGECEGDFDMDYESDSYGISDTHEGFFESGTPAVAIATALVEILNKPDDTPLPAPAGTLPVDDPSTEPLPPVDPTPEPTPTSEGTSAPTPETTPSPDTSAQIEPPPAAPEPLPESAPVAAVPEASLPDPVTETPPDATPPDTSVAEPAPPEAPPPAEAAPAEVPADDTSAPVADPTPDTSGEAPADDSSWSSDTTNTELTSTPLSLIDAKSLTFHDDGGAWDGVNKFRVHDGNARRVIPELQIRGTVSALGLSWTRYSNTIERAGRRNFGTASHWRHSWQYDLLSLAPEKGDTRARLALVYPDGTQRSLTRNGPATYASAMGYPERAIVGNGRVDLETGNGSHLLFVIQRRADKSYRYNLESITDPHGEITKLTYDAQGFLTRITELGSNRSLALTYKQFASTTTDRAIVASAKFPAAGTWVDLPVDPKTKANTWRYLRLRLNPSANPARVSEIQFFAPGSTTPLTGKVIGDLANAALAFDGNATTSARGDVSAFRYAGLDFGAAGSRVERIRVLVRAGAPFAECAVEGLATKPASIRVLTQVKSDDGRAVHYDYGTIRSRLEGVQDIGLVRTRYGDGTTAHYKYGYRLPEGYRPALVQAHDPRYAGRAKTVRYDYYPLRPEGSIGEIHRERDPGTGKTLATRYSDLAKDPLKRTITYGDQRQVVYTMTAKGERNAATRTDELGRTDRWEYSGKQQVSTARVRHNGDRIETQRDERGRLLSATHTPKNQSARKQALRRDTQGRATQHTDRHGRTQQTSRDAQGRITRIDHADGKHEARTYDGRGRLTALRSRDGATRTFTHNPRGLPATATDATGRTSRYAYNAHDQLVRVTDAAGRTTRLVRNEHGKVTQRINSDGTSRSYTYDTLGRHTRTTDELGRTTTKELDHLGRTTKLTDAAGNVTGYDYAELPNGCGACSMSTQPTNIRLPSGQQIAQLFDAAGRVVARTVAKGSADSATTTFTYDNNDRRLTTTDPKGRVTRYAYDAEGKLTTQTNHAGKTTRLGYDAFDNLATVTAPDGRARRFAYDQLGRLARETDAAGATTRYVYTAAGDLASLTDAKGNRYCFTYDEARRRTAMIYPDGSREKWGYDASGQLVSYTTRARQVKTVTYDGRARPVKVAWSPAGAAPTVTMEYDSGNQLKALDNGIARLTYSYDSIGRMLSETTRLAANVANVTPQTVAYAYGSFGQRSSLTYPDNTKIGYGYTGQGQLATVSVNGAAPLATYGYDVDGRVASVSRENGVSTRNTYDAIGQLQGIFHRKGSGVLASVEYANPDPSGRRASQTREDGLTERYAFDESGQLVGADYGVNSGAAGKPTRSVDYSYDALGNFQRVTETSGGITSTTDHGANRLNQYTRASEPGGGKLVNFSYDRSGNLTGVDGRGSRSDANHRYNALNQLVATESSGVRTEFFYDAKGRCITRKHYERVSNGRWALSGLASRVLNYDSRSLVTERRLDGSFVANYMHGSRIDEILAMVTPTGTFYPMHDALGSSVALTDRQGAVIERYVTTCLASRSSLEVTTGRAPHRSFLFDFCSPAVNGWKRANSMIIAAAPIHRVLVAFSRRTRFVSQEAIRICIATCKMSQPI